MYKMKPFIREVTVFLPRFQDLPAVIIENLTDAFENLPQILRASIDELDEVEGIGEIRARKVKEGLKRIQEQLFVDRHI